MSNKELLYEIKPKYNIAYTIITHFWDIAVFVFIVIVLRYTTRNVKKCDYCNYNCSCIGNSNYTPKK